MEESIFKIGEEVEVTSEEEGFKGAWFKATILTRKKKKFSVRYLTLLNDDGLTPLTETIDQRLIRPVPPENDVVLEEGTVVDADYKDGWWIGTVLKKRFEDDLKKFLVYFESPSPDIIEFEKKQVRAHFDWIGFEWVRPEIKEVDKSEFSPGTMVEVSSTLDNVEVTWLPAMLIKEIEIDNEKKFIVKDCNKRYSSCTGDEARPNSTVDSRRVRPQPPSTTTFSVDEEEASYKLMDRVEVLRGSSWRKGFVRGVLAEKQYRVRIEVTNEEYTFKHSELRPFKVWENGVWRNGSELQPVKVGKKKPYIRPMTPLTTPVRVTKAIKRSSNREENAAETSKVTSIGISPVTPSLVITETPLRRVEAETEGNKSAENEPMQNDSTRKTMLEDEDNNEVDKSRKRKRDQEHNSETDETSVASKPELNDTSKKIRNNDDDNVNDQPLSASIGTEISSNQAINMVNNTDVEVTPQAKVMMVLPFEKKSPVWKKCESMKSFKSVPQSPHFSPLSDVQEDIREWSALGMMVTFDALLEELKLDSTVEKLNSLSESFAKYEKYGFDVVMPQSRISKVLSLKDGQRKNAEEKKLVEKEIEEGKNEKRKYEKEMVKLQREILELKKREEIVKEKIKASDKKIDEMESNAEKIDQKIAEFEVEFEKIVSAPW